MWPVIFPFLFRFSSPVSWGCRIHWLHLCREAKPPHLMSILDITLNYLMVRPQPWSFGKCGVPLYYHYFQVHCDLEWKYLLGLHLFIKENYLIICCTRKHLNMLSTNYSFKNHMYKQDWALNNPQGLICN